MIRELGTYCLVGYCTYKISCSTISDIANVPNLHINSRVTNWPPLENLTNIPSERRTDQPLCLRQQRDAAGLLHPGPDNVLNNGMKPVKVLKS